jgi:nitrogen regulatory protein PII 2
MVPDSKVKDAVEAIIEANRTGHHGDGKIFICPVEEAIRIRTGETGSATLE